MTPEGLEQKLIDNSPLTEDDCTYLLGCVTFMRELFNKGQTNDRS